jgi:cytochrome c oxidase subunit 2
MMRRRLLLALVAGAVVGPVARSQERVIRIVARKFEFVPGEISLQKGVPAMLELVAEDVAMGFYAPALNVDVEFVPGKPVRVRVLPEQTGSYDFSCNVFCGDGHEDMGGKIHVA